MNPEICVRAPMHSFSKLAAVERDTLTPEETKKTHPTVLMHSYASFGDFRLRHAKDTEKSIKIRRSSQTTDWQQVVIMFLSEINSAISRTANQNPPSLPREGRWIPVRSGVSAQWRARAQGVSDASRRRGCSGL